MTTVIYGLTDPICEVHLVRYVGQTRQPLPLRLYGHIHQARSDHPSWCSHWIREVLLHGHEPAIKVLQKVDDHQADSAEREWIRRLGASGELLTNTSHYQSARVPPLAYVDRLWPDEMTGPYYIRVALGVVDGVLSVMEYSCSGDVPCCDPPWTGRETGTKVFLGGRDLQRIPVHRIARQLLDEMTNRWAPLLARLPSDAARAASDAFRFAPRPRSGRPILYGPEHWEEVSQVYREGGVKAVQERWVLNYSTAWRWCKRVRTGSAY